MSDTVIVALITGSVTLTVNLLANWSARKKEAVERAKRDQKLDDQIKELDAKVTSHNAYAEKFAAMTTAIINIQKDIEWMKTIDTKRENQS